MRLLIDIPDSLHYNFKVYVTKERTSMNTIITKLVEEYMEDKNHESRTRK